MNEQEFLNSEEASKPLQNKKEIENEIYSMLKKFYEKYNINAYESLQLLSNRKKIIDYIIAKSSLDAVEVEKIANSFYDKYNKQFYNIYIKDFELQKKENYEEVEKFVNDNITEQKKEKNKNILLAVLKIIGCILLFPLYLVLICSTDFEKSRRRRRRYM